MSDVDKPLANKAAALRREFDMSFARAPATELAAVDNFLAVRIGGDAYAIRVAEIAGLYVDRRIVALPSAVPSLLGTAGFRGQIAPVYDLALLLGYAAHAPDRNTLRWLVLARGREAVALAFDAFESQLMVSPQHVITGTDDGARPHVHGAVQLEGAPRPIVRLASVLEDIYRRVEAAHSNKER